MTENKKRRDDDLEQSSSSASALRNARGQEHCDSGRTRIKKYVTGSQQDGRVYVRILFKSWDLYQVRLLRCGILPSSLRVLSLLLVSLAGLPLLASCLLFVISVVLLRIRGFCDLI